MLCVIDRGGNVRRDLVRLSAVKKHHKRDRDVVARQRIGDLDDGIGAERMTDQHKRTVLASIVCRHDLAGDEVGVGMVHDRCRNPIGLKLGGEVIGVQVLIELEDLGGRKRLPDVEVVSEIVY